MTTLIVTTPAGLEGEARRELCRLLPGAEARGLPLKGNLLLLVGTREEEALATIEGADTRCVGRVVAVQRRVRLPEGAECFSEVAAAAAETGRIKASDTFVVRCNRRGTHLWQSRELERAVASTLERAIGATGDYSAAVDWRVAVEVYQDLAYVGVGRPEAMIRKKLRKQRKYAPGERPLNRAQLKLREALAAFAVELPPRALALDLGSAPGGWAAVLAGIAHEVVAVDPAELDPRVASLSNVRHLQCRAEELAGRDDFRGRFDLMTCDMNLDPQESAGILCRLADALKPGAPAIMTVKYVTRQRRRHDGEARAVLAQRFGDIRMRHLPHNARETTAAMRRKG
jgi:tRNA(Ser,Leu) C12 N-acetylase TAN1